MTANWKQNNIFIYYEMGGVKEIYMHEEKIVSRLSEIVALEVGICASGAKQISIAASLHDVGYSYKRLSRPHRESHVTMSFTKKRSG